jgi:hypothetical protein
MASNFASVAFCDDCPFATVKVDHPLVDGQVHIHATDSLGRNVKHTLRTLKSDGSFSLDATDHLGNVTNLMKAASGSGIQLSKAANSIITLANGASYNLSSSQSGSYFPINVTGTASIALYDSPIAGHSIYVTNIGTGTLNITGSFIEISLNQYESSEFVACLNPLTEAVQWIPFNGLSSQSVSLTTVNNRLDKLEELARIIDETIYFEGYAGFS